MPAQKSKSLPGKGSHSTAHERSPNKPSSEQLAVLEALWSNSCLRDRKTDNEAARAGTSPPRARHQQGAGRAAADGRASTSPPRARHQYGSWYMPTQDWKAVYAGSAEDEEALRHKLGLVSSAEVRRQQELVEKRSTLQSELGMSYTVKVFREYMRDHNLREPLLMVNVPAVTDEMMQLPVPAAADKMIGLGLAQQKLGAAAKMPQVPVNTSSTRRAELTSVAINGNAAAARALMEGIGRTDLEYEDIIPPEMREVVHRTVAINDMLQQHTAKVSHMEQRRQVKEAEWSRVLQSPKRRLNAYQGLLPRSPKSPASHTTASFTLPSPSSHGRASQPPSPKSWAHYPFHSSAPGPEPESPGSSSKSNSRPSALSPAAEQGEGTGDVQRGRNSSSRSNLASSAKPSPVKVLVEEPSFTVEPPSRAEQSADSRHKHQQSQHQHQHQHQQPAAVYGAGQHKWQAPPAALSSRPESQEPNGRTMVDLEQCLSPDLHLLAERSDVPLAVCYLAEARTGPAPPCKSPPAWKPRSAALFPPAGSEACRTPSAGCPDAEPGAARRWLHSSVPPMLRSAVQAAAGAQPHSAPSGGAQQSTPFHDASAPASRPAAYSAAPTPDPRKLPTHAGRHNSPHPDAVHSHQHSTPPPAASALDEGALAHDNGIWNQPSYEHLGCTPRLPHDVGDGLWGSRGGDQHRSREHGQGPSQQGEEGCNFSLTWLSRDKAQRSSVRLLAGRMDHKAKTSNSNSIHNGSSSSTTPNQRTLQHPASPHAMDPKYFFPFRAQSSLDHAPQTQTMKTQTKSKTRNRRLSS